jgi:hypothetical protein
MNTQPISVEIIFADAMKKIKDHREWYRFKASGKRGLSKTIRAFAIIIAGIGTVCPLLDATQALEGVTNLSRWGYVAFGVAAIFVGFDRFFGVSSGWTRYIMAMQTIDKVSSTFELDWKLKIIEMGGVEHLSKEQQIELIQMVKSMVVAVSEIVERETQNWANDFQSSLNELVKTASNSK